MNKLTLEILNIKDYIGLATAKELGYKDKILEAEEQEIKVPYQDTLDPDALNSHLPDGAQVVEIIPTMKIEEITDEDGNVTEKEIEVIDEDADATVKVRLTKEVPNPQTWQEFIKEDFQEHYIKARIVPATVRAETKLNEAELAQKQKELEEAKKQVEENVVNTLEVKLK